MHPLSAVAFLADCPNPSSPRRAQFEIRSLHVLQTRATELSTYLNDWPLELVWGSSSVGVHKPPDVCTKYE